MSWIEEAEAGLDIEAELGKAIAEAAEWKPEAGDSLIGTTRQIGAVITKYGLALKVFVELEDKSVTQVFGGASQFKEEFIQAAPLVGLGIAIRYDGKGEGEFGKQLYYVNAETKPEDRDAARMVIYDIIKMAEELKKSKADAKPEREPAPEFSGAPEGDDMEAPF